jgi:SPP1 family predicted phage head-tail adaptor
LRGYKNFESDPHPGDLKHLIQIGYTESPVNENGYPVARDVIVCKAWAAVTDAENQHYRAADAMNAEAVINFTIRYRSDIKPGMWVLFQGDKWNISTLGEYGFKRAYLGLKASIAKGVSG